MVAAGNAKASAEAKEIEGTSMDKLVKEGKALASIWKQTNSLKDSTKPNGFDTRLGKLLQQLKAQSTLDSGQVSRQTLTTYGIHTIDRRRRAEALWFVENEVECRDFMKASKKGFTSLSALQKAMNKASNEAKVSDKPAKAEPSDVGQSDEPKQAKLVQHSETKVSVPVTRSVMVNTIIKQCEANGLELEQIIDDLISRLAKQERDAG
jgi:hypothetical protein